MPLGFEVNNEMPALIQHSGDYMANQLVETGKTIQGILLRNQAFRETRQLGEQLSQINPTSDDYPQAAAAIVSQHPLAIQTGLAKVVLEPGMKAYAAAQAAKRTDALIKGRVDVAGARGGNSPVYIPNGGPRPDVGSLGADPLAEGNLSTNGGGGIAGVLKGTFDTMKGDEPGSDVPTAPGDSLLPADNAIPDAASAMRQRKSRPLQSYIDENSKVFNDALAAKQTPPFTRSQISTVAARQKAADDKEISALNTTPKVKATLVDAAGDLYRELADGSFLYPDGTKHVAAPNGLTRVAGAHEQERLDQSKLAAETRAARTEKTDVVKAVKTEYDDAVRDFATQDRLLHDLERDTKKITDPDALAAHQKVKEEQQVRAQQAKDRQAAALAAYKKTLIASGKVRVVKPDGTPGIIPKSQLEQALKEGYREQ
jgi:hypothetical protein